jgi:ABC-type amino acid transport substrate-binding protein
VRIHSCWTWLLSIVTALITLSAAAGARGSELDPGPGELRDLTQPLVVGVQVGDYPYSFRDKDGKVKGFAIDVVQAIARTMDLKLQERITNNDPEQLQSGELDILPLLAETEARRRLADFSVPVLRLEMVVVVRRDDHRIRHLSDLSGKRVAVGMPGTAGHEYLKQRHPNATVDFTPPPLALALVADGKLDAVVLSRTTAMSELVRQKLDALEILQERTVGFDVRRGIAVRHGDTLLLARLNEGLAILHRTGEFKEIQDRWLSQYDHRKFTWRELLASLSGLMLVAGLIVAFGWRRQRLLAQRVNAQDDELATQRSLLAALYENHPLATVLLTGTVGSAPKMMSWNGQATSLLGLSVEAPPGLALDELAVEPEMTRLIVEVLARWDQLRTGEPWETILGASHRVLESELLLLEQGTSGERRVCLLIGDVTLRRLAEQGAAQARRLQALGEMVGGIAHEFNNLLTPITATVDTMRRTFGAVDGIDADL